MLDEKSLGSADKLPKKVKLFKSKENGKPKSGDVCTAISGVSRLEGEVLYYFVDDEGIEHCRFKVGPTIFTRPTEHVFNKGEELKKREEPIV